MLIRRSTHVARGQSANLVRSPIGRIGSVVGEVLVEVVAGVKHLDLPDDIL